jgi:hypothetical protein
MASHSHLSRGNWSVLAIESLSSLDSKIREHLPSQNKNQIRILCFDVFVVLMGGIYLRPLTTSVTVLLLFGKLPVRSFFQPQDNQDGKQRGRYNKKCR